MKKIFSRSLSLFLMSSAFVVIQSCNNQEKAEKKDAETSVGVAPVGGGKGTPFVASPFVILKLEKQELLDLFSQGQVKKLLIQFSGENAQDSKILAIAYGAKPNNDTINGSKNLMPASAEIWDTTGKKILGNNELSEKKIRNLIRGPINAQNAKDLYFYPLKDSTNHIRYLVSTQLIAFKQIDQTFTITYPSGEYTNPSPPDPPCSTCDQ